MSTAPNKTNKKPNKNRKSESGLHHALAVLLMVLAFAMSILVAYALKGGIGVPEVGLGKVVASSKPLSQGSTPSTQKPDDMGNSFQEPTEPADPAPEQAQALLEGMTLEEKVWQMFFASADGLEGVYGVSRADDVTESGVYDRKTDGGNVETASGVLLRSGRGGRRLGRAWQPPGTKRNQSANGLAGIA